MRKLIAVAAVCAAATGVGAWAMGQITQGSTSLQGLEPPVAESSVPERVEVATDIEQRAVRRDAAVMRQNKALDVGDPDSFGRPLRWLGYMSSPTYYISTDCSQPYQQQPCLQPNPATGLMSTSLRDVARMTLPSRSIHSVLCHWQTPQINGTFVNNSTARRQMYGVIYPSVTLESEVLNGVSLINPDTGEPMDGKLELLGGGTRIGTMLEPGERMLLRHSDTRACLDGTLTRQSLVDYFGLSEEQARQLLAKPMTLRLNLDIVALNGMDGGYFSFGVRYVGD